MITRAAFFGDARHDNVVTDILIFPNEPRSRNLNVTVAGKSVILPDPITYQLQPGGRARFHFLNTGTQSVTITSSPAVVVAPNEVAAVFLLMVGGVLTWRTVKSSINVGKTYHVDGTRTNPADFPDPFSLPVVKTYTDGSCVDPCTDALGVAARVPMWINSCIARNTGRDPIRGADLLLNPYIQLTVTNGLVHDATHSGAVPSTELFTALRQKHTLVYNEALSVSGATRNPYHLGLHLTSPTAAWRHPASTATLTVTRKVWQRLVTYKKGTQTFTIDIRFVAEWILDMHKGLWGSLFTVYALQNEVNPTYVSGTNDATQNNCPFTAADPFVWGPLYAGANTHQKFFHPQLLFVASIPTTFHAPCNYIHIPAGNERWPQCYKRTNGAPWSSNLPNDAASNTVFAAPDAIDATGFTDGRGMTIGGDVPVSELYPFLCIENGAGYGGTILKPTNAGWDEAEGDLTPSSDLSITTCEVSQVNAIVDVCQGHPDAPYGGVGGTHRCFKTSDHAQYCCLSPFGSALITIFETCCQDIDAWAGDDGMGYCAQTVNTGPDLLYLYYESSYTAPLKDYDFSFLDATQRIISWAVYACDPGYVPTNFTSYGDLTPVLGTWTVGGSSITLTATSGAAFLTGEIDWTPAGWAYYAHGRVQALCKASVAAKRFTIGTRWNAGSGYIFEFDAGTGTMRIWSCDSAGPTQTLLATSTGAATSADFTMEIVQEGTSHTLNANGRTLSVENCDWTCQGTVMFGTRSSAAGAGVRFDNIIIEDHNANFTNTGSFVVGPLGSVMQEISAEVRAGATEQEIQLFKNTKIQQKLILGSCTGGINPGCTGVTPNCGCTRIAYIDCKWESTLTAPDNADVNYINVLGGGTPHPELCNGAVSFCNGPGLLMDSRVILPSACATVPTANKWIYCGGAEWWWYVPI